jgi:hypothetical protein
MKTMMAAVMLVMVGVVLGMAVGTGAARAQTLQQFVTVSRIEEMPDAFMNGYVAGAADMLVTAAEKIPDLSAENYVQLLHEQAACLNAKGHTIGELKAWVKYRVTIDAKQYPNDAATSIIAADACK